MRAVCIDVKNREATILEVEQVTPTMDLIDCPKGFVDNFSTRIFDLLVVEDEIAVYLEQM